MNASINFLKDRQRRLTKNEQWDRRLLMYSGALLGGSLVLLVAMIGVNWWYTSTITSLQERQVQLKQTITLNEELEKSYLIFANKLKVLREVFGQQSDKQAAISYFSEIFGPNVLINEMDYAADKALLTFGLRTEDVFVMERVFELLGSKQVADQFMSLERSELRRSADGSYEIKVTVVLKTDKPPSNPAGTGSTTKPSTTRATPPASGAPARR